MLHSMEVDRHGLEVLSRDECLRLLREATLGRIAITSGALPTILPVNFSLAEDQILFRTARGTKLDAATENAVVAFEVDEMHPMGHDGWSVVVTGVAREVTGDAIAAVAGPIPRWAPEHDGRVVAISLDLVSGRRIVHGVHPPADD